MAVFQNDALIAEYPVSTSKFAESDLPGSRGTPLGELEIAKKIGGNAPSGMKFKDRKPTGEIVAPDAPGRDPIVSRILWLRGLEPQNANAYGRYIYIHGTAEESKIGTKASFGCVRMRSNDVIQLFNIVGVGARVQISAEPIAKLMPEEPQPQSPQMAQQILQQPQQQSLQPVQQQSSQAPSRLQLFQAGEKHG